MPIFNNKEIEALQAENTALKDKITTFEVRLSARDKKISECDKTIERLNGEIEKYQAKLSATFSSHEVNKLQEEIAALKKRPRNERGAGRKPKATPEQRDYIISLFSQGISQNKIAKIMTEQTGDQWNKTTIRNMIISAKK